MSVPEYSASRVCSPDPNSVADDTPSRFGPRENRTWRVTLSACDATMSTAWIRSARATLSSVDVLLGMTCS